MTARWISRLGLPVFRVRDVLALVVCCGIVSGILEAGVVEIGARVLHLPAGQLIPPELFWYAPLAMTTCLLVVALIVLLIDRAVPRIGLLQLVVPLVIGIAGFSLIRSLRQGVASIAAVVLALGLATVLARLFARRLNGVRRAAPRLAAAMIVMLVLLGAAIPISRRVSERRALAKLPAPPAGAPNVLVIVLDAVRHFDLSLYGYARATTPNLTEFARRGVTFDRAFSTAPWSLPGHASMLTGLYPNEMSTGHRQALDDTPLMLSEYLTRHGYATGGFVGNMSFLQPDFGLARGFVTYDSRPPASFSTIASTSWLTGALYKSIRAWRGGHEAIPSRPADDVKEALLQWVDRRGNRPFFAFVNLFDAHTPYLPPAPYDTAFGRHGRYWASIVPRRYSPTDLDQMQRAYDGAIRYMDAELKALLDGLEQRGVLNNTVVIVTSDHGEEFGEHDPSVVEHSLTLYTTSMLVPMVLVYPPKVSGGGRRSEPVSVRDIPATVIALTGVTDSTPFPGVSLARYADSLSPPAPTPRAMSVEKKFRGKLPAWTANNGDLYGVVDSSWHFFLDAQGKAHLYDLDQDLWERTNLAGTNQTADVQKRLRFLVDSLLSGPDGTLRARAPSAGRSFGGGRQLRRR